MKTKSIVEFLSLSCSLYVLAKNTELLERIKELSGKGKDEIDKIISETKLDENGEELKAIDKIILKSFELKEEFYEKVEQLVAEFYKKVNIAHIEEINGLNARVEQADRTIALLEARLNKLEEK
ncbi:hypothetical protein ACFQ5N_11115 [Lutibacter holmesii]|uniref:Uncharacterized protein n=1 Tax=Lutibacter holmesii TaxID=1137985 RepID=A0ABW3WPQ6_9FLAO